MVQGPSLEAISVLTHGQTEQKIQVARDIKNNIVGHDQRKELAIKFGIVQPLADIISSASKTNGKRRQDSNGVALHQAHEWTAEDELRLQAALIVGSLASGGQPFLQPLCAGNIPDILVTALSLDLGPRLVTAVLQAIKAIATFWSTSDEPAVEYDLWSAIFSIDSLNVFDVLVRQVQSSPAATQQLRLVAEILSVIPESEHAVKGLITNSGFLDTLSSLLVSHAIHNKLVWYHGDCSQLPPAPPHIVLPSLLAAISSIISGSSYRTHRFIHAAHVRNLFLQSGNDASDHRALFGPKHGFSNPHDSLLPPLYIPTYKTISHNHVSNAFPALRTMRSGKPNHASTDVATAIGDIDHSNAVIGWLLVLVRELQGISRLVALRLLALVARAMAADPMGISHETEFAQKLKERQKQLAMLAVPLAVQLVQTANEGKGPTGIEEQKDSHATKEQACSILALLIGGTKDFHKELQIAAVEANAVKHVCSILKKSFDNVSLSKPMWTSRKGPVDDPNSPQTCRLGRKTLPSEIAHSMKCREGALRAIEAIAAHVDVHRKAIIDSGGMSCIIDSLKPFAANVAADVQLNRAQISPKDGNTVPVILAACGAAQAMARSVSILRTSLIDAGIAKPVIQLLLHADLEVQIAATDVCVNILPEFSPMREELSQNNVIETFTEHARSNSPALRLSSLWALKHLVNSCPKDVKMSALEHLTTGWLVSTIQGEQREVTSLGGGVSIGMSTPNAAGEQVDLLNPSTMDVDEPPGAEIMDEDDEDGEILFDEASSTHYQASQLRSTLSSSVLSFNSKRYLSSIREYEQNDEYAARRHEASFQQQALDFVRNFISGEDCAALSDYIMNQIGSAKVYELLTAKLQPLPRSLTGGRQVYNTTELVLSTVHVIIHLANASPKHRQMLIAQKPLLQALLPHFRHVDHRVRTMCVWAVTSLTWVEEDGDRRDARNRANELKLIGIEQAVRGLENDENMDVKERVKTALRHFEQLC